MTCPCPKHPLGCYGHPNDCGCSTSKLPSPETMLAYASILEKPQYYIHNRQKFLMPRSEVIDAAIEALRVCATLSSQQRSTTGE